MTSFSSVNLYDKQFDDICEAYGGKKGNACPYFAILTLHHFMNGEIMTPERYYENLLQGNIVSAIMQVKDGIEMTDLLSHLNGKYEEMACTAQMLTEGVFSIQDYLEAEGKCGFLFLKNEKFFVIMKDVPADIKPAEDVAVEAPVADDPAPAADVAEQHQTKYHLWDCHQDEQYTFTDVPSIIVHLNEIYNFNNTIKIDGISFDEYNSIEMVKFTEPFQTTLLEFQAIGDQ